MTRPTLLALLLAAPLSAAEPPDAAKLAFFEKEVRPLLASHCYACHAADTKPAGRFDSDNDGQQPITCP